MLSKEVKEILEGTHFFLSEGLKDECLSGKVECLRRGLLLQLEALRSTYSFLHFSSSSSSTSTPSFSSSSTNLDQPNANIRHPSSLPYLHVEQTHVTSSRMSTSSSSTNYSSTGGSNGSSTGYSGDGEVTAANQIDKKTENYEDFEEIQGISDDAAAAASSPRRRSGYDPLPPPSTGSRAGAAPAAATDEGGGAGREDESYAEEVEPVSFRILIGKCEHHGTLCKRTKGLLPGLRSTRSFHGVLTANLLYLFLKESDDRQKKVIDLSGYRVEEEQPADEGGGGGRGRRREFAFQLVAPAKKTHTFVTGKRSSLEGWMTCLKRATSFYSPSSGDSRQGSSSPADKDAALAKEEQRNSNQDIFPEEGEQDEFYEELNPEDNADADDAGESEAPSGGAPPHPSLWKPPLQPYQLHSSLHQQSPDDTSQYYSVPEGGDPPPLPAKPTYYNQQKQKQQRVPPQRPPLPDLNRAKTHQQDRPLPEAPEGEYEGSDDEIYCEIDEELVPGGGAPFNQDIPRNGSFPESMNDLLIGSNSLSKEIFDTINERVPTLPARTYNINNNNNIIINNNNNNNNMNRRWNEMSFRSTGSTDTESYDVPSDVTATPSTQSSPSWKLTRNGSTNQAPSLPPKGVITPSNLSDEESEYKVPSFTACPESLYHVPCSNPVPVVVPSIEITKDTAKHSSVSEEDDDQSLSDSVNNNNSTNESHENIVSVNDESEKSTDDCEVVVVESRDSIFITDSNNLENNSPFENEQSKTIVDKIVKINSSNSVKDLIAKLNQNDESSTDSSHHQNFGSSNNFRRSKHNINIVDKPFLVETKNKIEVSRSVQSIKNDLQNKDKVTLDIKEGDNVKQRNEKCNDESDESVLLILTHGSDSENIYQNCGQDSNSLDRTSEISNGVVYIAKFAFVSRTSECLSFNRGEEVLVVRDAGPNERLWWGVVRGREGLVPREYLRRKED